LVRGPYAWQASALGRLIHLTVKLYGTKAANQTASCFVEKIIPQPGPVKVCMDGALCQQRTAAMFQPYLNEPANRGMLNMDGGTLSEYDRRVGRLAPSMQTAPEGFTVCAACDDSHLSSKGLY
jgi:predicted amidohydrolase YtcJ